LERLIDQLLIITSSKQ